MAGPVVFTLQDPLGDFHIAQGHIDILVPEQLHESGQVTPSRSISLAKVCLSLWGVTWVEQPARFAAWANADRRVSPDAHQDVAAGNLAI